MDAGPPISYEVLERGTPVRSSEGSEVGTVEHVLAAEEEDIFDGLVVKTDAGSRFADAAQVAEIRERAVKLSLDATACERLPEPSENPPAMGVDPADTQGGELQAKLRRAWDLLSGNY